MGFESLQGYVPQKMNDGFEVIKDNGLKCSVDYARIEDYTGDKEELLGARFFGYQLSVLEGKYAGRRLWKRFNIGDDKALKKLADQLFTVGLEFKNEEELLSVAETFVTLTVKAKAWGWKPEGSEEPIQQHLIKGIATDATTATSIPF